MSGMAESVAPAPGGALQDYVEHLRSRGESAALSPDGSAAWVPGAGGEAMRLPPLCMAPAPADQVRQMLRQRGIWVVSYLTEPGPATPPNCFVYVCREAYELVDLKKRVRAAVRKALKDLTVRLCTWDELAEKGYPAYSDTDTRHAYPAPAVEEFQAFVDRRRGSRFIDVWGAWAGEELAGWLTVLKVDNWAVYDASKSATAHLDKSPSNALYFLSTRQALLEEKRAYVSSGISTVQAGVDPVSLHRFKARMRHEAVPLRRVFVPHPLFRWIFKSRATAWTLDKLASTFTKYGFLGKAAGLSANVAGVENDPLAWAEALGGK